jgi:ParB-like chromosome segregation protein Spo0J
MQRKTLSCLKLALFALAALIAATGCTRQIIGDNLRSSLTAFTTGVVSSAINSSFGSGN